MSRNLDLIDLLDYTSTDCIVGILRNYTEIENLALTGSESVLNLYVGLKRIFDLVDKKELTVIMQAIQSHDEKLLKQAAKILQRFS